MTGLSLKQNIYLIKSYQFQCSGRYLRDYILDLSEAAWINDGEPQNYEAYKRSFKDMFIFELGR